MAFSGNFSLHQTRVQEVPPRVEGDAPRLPLLFIDADCLQCGIEAVDNNPRVKRSFSSLALEHEVLWCLVGAGGHYRGEHLGDGGGDGHLPPRSPFGALEAEALLPRRKDIVVVLVNVLDLERPDLALAHAGACGQYIGREESQVASPRCLEGHSVKSFCASAIESTPRLGLSSASMPTRMLGSTGM